MSTDDLTLADFGPVISPFTLPAACGPQQFGGLPAWHAGDAFSNSRLVPFCHRRQACGKNSIALGSQAGPLLLLFEQGTIDRMDPLGGRGTWPRRSYFQPAFHIGAFGPKFGIDIAQEFDFHTIGAIHA